MNAELDQNKFFIYLKKKCSSLYKTAKQNKCIICVPQSSSLSGVKMNKKLIEAHILKPYPRFLNEYISMRTDKQFLAKIENSFVTPVTGYEKNDPVLVLNEELCYENDIAYYVYLTDRVVGTENVAAKLVDSNSSGLTEDEATPLGTIVGMNPRTTGKLQQTMSLPRLSSKTSDVEPPFDSSALKNSKWYISFLYSDRAFAKSLVNLEEEVELFNRSFVFFGVNHLPNTAEIIRAIYERNVIDFEQSKDILDDEEESDLCVAIESFIVEGIAVRLYRSIHDQYKPEMIKFSQLCPLFSKFTYDDLKIDPIFDCSLSYTVDCLETIRDVVTPIDILTTLHCALRNIAIDVKNHARQVDPFGLSSPNVSADELVPLAAKAIALSNLIDLEKYIQVVQYFHFSFTNMDGEFDYALTTFIAAKQLIFESFPDFQFLPESTVMPEVTESRTPKKTSPRKFKKHSLHFPNLPKPPEKSKQPSDDSEDTSPRNSSLFSHIRPNINNNLGADRRNNSQSLMGVTRTESVNSGSTQRRPKRSPFVMPAAIEIPQVTIKQLHKQNTYAGDTGSRPKSELLQNSDQGQEEFSIFEQLHNDPLFICSSTD